jgi:hypothetical protein
MLTGYAIGLFFHFVGMIALYIGFGLEWTGSSLLRHAATSDQARSWLGLYRTSQLISGPGWLLLILSGGYLASVTGGMKQGWIFAALIGIVVALYIGFVMILPRVKKLRVALPEGNVPLPAAALSGTMNPMIATLVRVRFMLSLGIVALMTYKPAMLSTSLVVLLGGIVLGVLCSIGVLSKRAAQA